MLQSVKVSRPKTFLSVRRSNADGVDKRILVSRRVQLDLGTMDCCEASRSNLEPWETFFANKNLMCTQPLALWDIIVSN